MEICHCNNQLKERRPYQSKQACQMPDICFCILYLQPFISPLLLHARREDYGSAEFTDCSSLQPLSQTQGCYCRLSSTSSCKHSQTLPEWHGTAPIILSDSHEPESCIVWFFPLVKLELGETRGQRGVLGS